MTRRNTAAGHQQHTNAGGVVASARREGMKIRRVFDSYDERIVKGPLKRSLSPVLIPVILTPYNLQIRDIGVNIWQFHYFLCYSSGNYRLLTIFHWDA